MRTNAPCAHISTKQECFRHCESSWFGATMNWLSQSSLNEWIRVFSALSGRQTWHPILASLFLSMQIGVKQQPSLPASLSTKVLCFLRRKWNWSDSLLLFSTGCVHLSCEQHACCKIWNFFFPYAQKKLTFSLVSFPIGNCFAQNGFVNVALEFWSVATLLPIRSPIHRSTEERHLPHCVKMSRMRTVFPPVLIVYTVCDKVLIL